MTKRKGTQVTLEERKHKALIALYHWEFSAALTHPAEFLFARLEFLEKAGRLLRHEPQSIEFLTKDAQICAVKDAIEARGLKP